MTKDLMGLFDILLNPVSILTSPISNAASSFIDNVIRDTVDRPAIGSVVFCELVLGQAEHSGVYIGDDTIVHLDGSGDIEAVSSATFLARLGGWNSAISIYVSCRDGNPVGSLAVAERARKSIGESRKYHLLLENCHQFTAGCLSGDFASSCTLFTLLKWEAEKRMGMNKWRVWKR
ncbi:lecithin retinol acyltransferase family protein [Janthinobacterium sp. RB2P8]|uniref:lecithin retinol acyltransferase family protein n=1 Tax=Janthinobacterium sp. RB2P8 TaxID=3424191 RepID=UPI003F287062